MGATRCSVLTDLPGHGEHAQALALGADTYGAGFSELVGPQ